MELLTSTQTTRKRGDLSSPPAGARTVHRTRDSWMEWGADRQGSNINGDLVVMGQPDHPGGGTGAEDQSVDLIRDLDFCERALQNSTWGSTPLLETEGNSGHSETCIIWVGIQVHDIVAVDCNFDGFFDNSTAPVGTKTYCVCFFLKKTIF